LQRKARPLFQRERPPKRRAGPKYWKLNRPR